MVGVNSGAPSEAVEQILIIYIISPLLWICTLAALTQTLGVDKLINWLMFLAFLCCLSVALYFYFFLTYGAETVTFFNEKHANVNTSEGYVGASMNVYGSLIFLCGAFFSAPEVIKNSMVRIVLLGSLAICALTSGRSALIGSVFIGAFLNFCFSYSARHSAQRRLRSPAVALVTGAIGVSIAFLLLVMLTEASLGVILGKFFEELFAGGGDVRTEQTAALLQATIESYGLGSGHGIGIKLIRSNEYPWRYESVWFATLFRVGLIGSLVYLAPIVFYLYRVFLLIKARDLTRRQVYVFRLCLCLYLGKHQSLYRSGRFPMDDYNAYHGAFLPRFGRHC